MTRQELDRLRRALRRTQRCLAACLLAAVALVALGMSPSLPRQEPAHGEVLRVKGIVVEDAEGRARILIGAPVPLVSERIRTDRDKVLAAWRERFGNDMDWYFRNVKNEAFGMLILDDKGHDRIAIGSPTPDPNTGARMEPSHGIQFNNEEGIEVGGVGYFEERQMIGLGLDNPAGEGLYLLASKNGTSGMIVNDHEDDRRLFVGLAVDGSGLAPDGKRLGATIKDADGKWWVLGPERGFVPASETGK